MKNTVILLSGVLCLLPIGCTNSFGKVQGAISSAPDWYDNRKTEIRGAGYPNLTEVPLLTDGELATRNVVLSREEVEALRNSFDENPLAQLPEGGSERIERVIESVHAQFESFDSTSNFLTDAEVEAIRQSFNVPRVTQGLKGQK
ncbi:MAG: hypothetical protein ACRBEQ_13050 [Hyphomonas sp.]